ncbi:hypothetical protein ACP4OV_022615 [Aristida adscensionis]
MSSPPAPPAVEAEGNEGAARAMSDDAPAPAPQGAGGQGGAAEGPASSTAGAEEGSSSSSEPEEEESSDEDEESSEEEEGPGEDDESDSDSDSSSDEDDDDGSESEYEYVEGGSDDDYDDDEEEEEEHTVECEDPQKGAEAAPSPSCSICMERCASGGAHRVCCIPCGHVYGRSCLDKWLRRSRITGAKCPQCGQVYRSNQIRNLFITEHFGDGDNCCTIEEPLKMDKSFAVRCHQYVQNAQERVGKIVEDRIAIFSKDQTVMEIEGEEDKKETEKCKLEWFKGQMMQMIGSEQAQLMEFVAQNWPSTSTLTT